MVEPVSTGTLVAGALAAGAGALAKGVLGEAAKDAYARLKGLVASWAAGDVAQLETDPDSTARGAVVAEVVDRQANAEDKAQAQALAAALVAALKQQAAAGPVGIDIGRLEALEVDLGRVEVSEGTGFRAEVVKTDSFRTDGLEVGPGKS